MSIRDPYFLPWCKSVARKWLLSQGLHFPSTPASRWSPGLILTNGNVNDDTFKARWLSKECMCSLHFWEDSETQGQGSAKYILVGKSSLPLVLVIKFYWNRALLSHVMATFCATTTEMRNGRGYVAIKA